MIRLALAFLMLPTLTMASDWQGIWSADPTWCVQADNIGSVNPAPILLSATEMRGYESSCAIVAALPIGPTNAWHIQAACEAEGDSYSVDRIVMVDADMLFMWFGDAEPIPFTRCPE